MFSQTTLKLLNASSIANLTSVAPTPNTDCNTFRGVCSPSNQVFLGPDFSSGFFTGFTMWYDHMNDNGPFKAISQMPVSGITINPFNNDQDTAGGPDQFGHGYYKVVTGSNITVELGASNHSGIYQYTFPADNRENAIVIVPHLFQLSQGNGLSYRSGSFEVLSDQSYQGIGHYVDKNETNHNISFCGYFDSPTNATLFELNGNKVNTVGSGKSANIRHTLAEHRIAAVFTFPNTTIVSRVGISKATTDEACRNVNAELPNGVHITYNGVSDAGVSEITMARSSTTSGTKPSNTAMTASSQHTSTENKVNESQMSGHHFKVFVILLGIILGMLFLCFIILFALCVGAHKHFKADKKQNNISSHFRSGGMRQRDGAADNPPRL